MTRLPLTIALALVLTACGQSNAPATSMDTASPEALAAASEPSARATGTTLIAGTGDATPAAAPATDEVVATAGSDAEDTQYFDFSGPALEKVRNEGRAATPELRDAARRLVDATGEERECGTYPEGERLFMLDLDGQPGDEALLLYTMEGCGGGGNYYDRSGYVLREVDGAWKAVADFPLGTKLVGNATISALEPGVVVVSPEGDSVFEQQRVEIPPR
ncbi:hypothetical protein [Luteimonas changyuni]|uniref:hypothetical protein n=1 Tax=Luteimonas sp. MJ145 TaxID=3129234 RepID=UPI0031BB9D67